MTRLQARLLIAQISQLQTQIHRIEEEIEQQVPFEAAAERLMADPVSAYTHYKVVRKFYRKIKRRSGKPVARAVVAKELAKGVCSESFRDDQEPGI